MPIDMFGYRIHKFNKKIWMGLIIMVVFGVLTFAIGFSGQMPHENAAAKVVFTSNEGSTTFQLGEGEYEIWTPERSDPGTVIILDPSGDRVFKGEASSTLMGENDDTYFKMGALTAPTDGTYLASASLPGTIYITPPSNLWLRVGGALLAVVGVIIGASITHKGVRLAAERGEAEKVHDSGHSQSPRNW